MIKTDALLYASDRAGFYRFSSVANGLSGRR